MRIVFTRGFLGFLPDIVHDLPEPIADIHLRAGRARLADAVQLGKTDDAQAGADEEAELLTDAAGAPAKTRPTKHGKSAKSAKSK